ncbi:AtpZ/AtpI family protein [uncultured Polaribacter sp.]|uniref:AtpZ/AtpI family protein n=1 Tax=uncultured Polaribacter sp. TaxID=174711 RepID=UPI00261058DC|nr:AtpZ/AtpI family protein [uncultured Polaribacter sp.]
MKQKNEKTKPLNKAIALSGAGLQMGLTIYAGFTIGKWLDAKFNTTFLMIICTLLAIVLSTFLLIKQANRIND